MCCAGVARRPREARRLGWAGGGVTQRCVFTLPDSGFPSEGATRPNKEDASHLATAIIENKAGFYLSAGIAVTDQEAFTAFTETS